MQTKVLGILQNTPENEPFMYLVDTNIPNNTAFFFFQKYTWQNDNGGNGSSNGSW